MIFDLHGFGPALVAGTLVTIQLALSSLALGLVLGLLGALAKTSPNKFLQGLGGTYSTIVRGVPELLWVLLIYFGTVSGLAALGEFLGVGSLELNPFAAGTIALIGATAMAGYIGGGGIGNIALTYGYQTFNFPLMFSTVFILIAFVWLIQSLGNLLSQKRRTHQ